MYYVACCLLQYVYIVYPINNWTRRIKLEFVISISVPFTAQSLVGQYSTELFVIGNWNAVR
jgi:hypothetical protein